MIDQAAIKSSWAKIAFALLIAASSADAFYKYTGFVGIAAYAAFCIVAVLLGARPEFAEWIERELSERRAIVLAAVTLVLLVVVCLLVYPKADAGQLGDRGSDADDALIIGAQALLRGAYPFYQTT